MNFKIKILFMLIFLFSFSIIAQSEEGTILIKEKKLTVEELSKKGYSDIEGLKQIEGLHYIRKGKDSLDVNIRGLYKDDINVLIDGEKVYGSSPHRTDPASTLINLDNLKSIEIIKGPYDVKNQGSMGGAIYTKSKDIKLGSENEFKLKYGSYEEEYAYFRSAYGVEKFKISLSGSYRGNLPYKDGKGKSLTKQHPDVDHPLYFFPIPATINIEGTNYNTAQLNYEYPGLLPFDYITAPSSTRYKYSNRNILTEKKDINLKTILNFDKNQELEIDGDYQTISNSLTPYLIMDMLWYEFKKGSIKYTIKDINDILKKISFKLYGNEILHNLNDKNRCAAFNSNDCMENKSSRRYGTSVWSNASVNGFRIDLETGFLQKTNFGVDTYLRKWNINSINRLTFPLNVKKNYPDNISSPPQPAGEKFRTQNTVPETYTNNIGFYIENEHKKDKLKHKLGIRYDINSTKAKKDRRILYNIYYPQYDPIYYFQYISYTEAYTTIDAEFYIPKKEPQRSFAEGSGFTKWEYEFNKELTGKFGLGYSARFPDPQELFYALNIMGLITGQDFVGNPLLKPTRNKQIDIGIELNKIKTKFEFDIFYSSLDNFNIIRSTPDHLLGNISKNDPIYNFIVYSNVKFYQDVNANITNFVGLLNPMSMYPYGRFAKTIKQVDATLYGGEISFKHQINEEYFIRLGTSYTRGINNTENHNLAEIPPWKGIVSLKYLKNKYYIELEGEFSASQNLVDKNFGEKRTPGWGIGNIYIGYELGENETNNTKITGGIRNIFNKYYYEHLSYFRDPSTTNVRVPEPGRNVYIQLEIKL